jgi:Aspartyl/Asparaginyl beta-hydroxylase
LLDGYQHLVAHMGSGRKPIDWPFVAEPLIWMGFHEIAHGTLEAASELGRAAAARLEQWGTPWDKRLPLRQWLQLCAALCDETKADELAFVARRTAAVTESASPSPQLLYMELARAELLPAGRDADAQPALPRRFQNYIAGLRTNHQQPRMTTYPGLRSMPWHDPQQFGVVRDLEAIADKVAAEVHALAAGAFQDEAENINRSGRWSVLFLYERGRKNEHNCSLCPQTVAVIEANRTVLSLGGLAYFSLLEPDTHIAPHKGPTNLRLRCHLGIDVPAGCGLRVGGIARTWEEGRCLVFDDSCTHEAWNDSDRPRVVLVVDLWHPDLSDDEVALLSGLHRYATATGIGLIRYWNRNRTKT